MRATCGHRGLIPKSSEIDMKTTNERQDALLNRYSEKGITKDFPADHEDQTEDDADNGFVDPGVSLLVVGL